MTRFKYVPALVLSLFMMASVSGAADILVDDFTDALASHQKGWRAGNTFLTADVGGGSLVLANTSDMFATEYHNVFAAPKPSTFTISYVVKSVTPQYGNSQPGLMFCRSEGLSGYQLIRYDANHIMVFKYVGGSAVDIFSARSAFLKPTDNKYTVSKQGSEFHIFVNDVYAGKFTDTQYNSGDVAFLMLPGLSATIGDFRMTDQFTNGTRSAFFDNFESGDLREWQYMTSGSSAPDPTTMVTTGGGLMKVNTPASGAVWAFVNVEPGSEFIASVEVRHTGGGSGSAYGMFLLGAGQGQEVNFAISGDRGYAAWSSGAPTFLPPHNDIFGSTVIGGQTYADKIEIRRVAGATTYEFYANNVRLNITLPVAGFEITGVGLFVNTGLNLEFDNFLVSKDGTMSVRDRPTISRKPAALVREPGNVFYDLRGRKRYSTAVMPGRLPGRGAMAAGVYVNENGRDVRVKKDRR